jgi:CRP/FNR family cyclic AMP-dependent transcriptional regulator
MNGMPELLAEQAFLAGFSEPQMQRLSLVSRRSTFQAGARIFDEGDPADRFWLIREGRVQLDTPVPRKRSLAIDTLGPGEVLGWSWLFAPYRWNFGAAAVQTTQTIEFDAACVRHLCDSEPEMGYELTRRFVTVVVRRLQQTRKRLVQQSRASSWPMAWRDDGVDA